MTQTLVLLGFKMLIMLRHLDMMQMEKKWPLLVVTNFKSDATGGMDRKYMAGKKKKVSNMLKIFDNQKT